MKKILTLLLTSSALLMACGAEEPEATEGTVEESATDALTEEDEQVAEPTDEDVTDTGFVTDSGDIDDEDYFSIYYHQGNVEIDNRLEDTSELSGLYSVELTDNYFTRPDVPQETFIDIKEDGRATVLTYQLLDHTDVDKPSNGYDATFVYFDEQNNLIQVTHPTPFRVVLASGFLAQEFGETQFKFVEYSYVHPHYNEKGEMALSSLMNPVSRFIRSELPRNLEYDGNKKEPIELSLDEVKLTEAKSEDVGLPFLLNNGGLLSVGQVDVLLYQQDNDRIQKKVDLGTYDDDPTPIYFEDNNELMQYLVSMDTFLHSVTLADDPSEYNGYSQDNAEIAPEVVFVNHYNQARTLHEDGTYLQYDEAARGWR